MAGLLTRLRRAAAPLVKTPVSISALVAAIGDADLASRIAVRISTTARRVSLRVDPTLGQIVLVQPVRASARSVLAFTASKRDWIAAHLEALPEHIAFKDGAVIPLRGVSHTVRFVPAGREGAHLKNSAAYAAMRGGVWLENGEIFVAGRTEHGARRLTDWLKAHAKTAIGPTARTMAQQIKRDVAYVGVRDTTSRWGSCTQGGRLSFSWRLILAPEHVLTYVIAHEVAHLKHMNHGPAFWQTVEDLLVGHADEAGSARDWLRRHGAALHRYG